MDEDDELRTQLANELRTRFAAELEEVRRAAGGPSPEMLERQDKRRKSKLSAKRVVLSKSRIDRVLRAQHKEAPDLDFVRDFLATCESYAKERNLPLDQRLLTWDLWQARHKALVEALETLRTSRPRKAPAAYRIEPYPSKGAPPAEAWRHQPSQLLLARHQVVPFTGRADDLARLERWRDTDEPVVAVGMLHGPGGQGKTRLVAQLAQATGPEWKVWQAVRTGEAAPAPAAPSLGTRALVVVDYADRWPAMDLRTLLQRVARRSGQKLRVLLVARSAGAWWASWQEDLRQWGYLPSTFELGPARDITERRQAFLAARDRFAAALGLGEVEDVPVPVNLAEPAFGLSLNIHMAALVAVDARLRGAEPPRDPQNLSAYLLDRERAHWARRHSLAPDTLSPDTMAQVVYTATLTRPLVYDTARDALARVEVESSAPVGQLLREHRACYPPSDPTTCLEPLYPDRLGEDFIALTTPGHPAGAHQSTPWADGAVARLLSPAAQQPGPWTRDVLTILISAAERWPHLTRGQLTRLLTEQPELAPQAGSAALTTLAGMQDLDISVLRAIEPHLAKPHAQPDLDPGIAAVCERVAAHRLAETDDAVEHARVYDVLARRQSWAGLHQRALTSARYAVAIREQLAEMDQESHEDDLAQSLRELAANLSAVGRYEEALAATSRALEINQRRAPGEVSHAISLTNLGVYLLELGRREETLEASQQAVEMWRLLAPGEPENASHYAGALGNLGVCLAELGRTKEALAVQQEALDIQARLAVDDPAAHEPALVLSLTNITAHLSRLGMGEQALGSAEQAVEVSRRLSALNPALFDDKLAKALNHLSHCLAAGGRSERALAAAEEAVTITQRLAAINPAAHEPGYALALDTLGNRWAGVGELAKAVPVTELAVLIMRRLAEENRAAHEHQLAESLHNLGARLIRRGLKEEAVEPCREAATIFRRLTESNLAAHGPRLAATLSNLTHCVPYTEGLALLEEKIALRRRLTETDSAEHEPELARLLAETAIKYCAAGHREGTRDQACTALPLVEEAVERQRRLASVDFPAHAPDLVHSLITLTAIRSSELSDHHGALPAANEAAQHAQLLVDNGLTEFQQFLDNARAIQATVAARAKEAEV
ncbi:tetratricopeptide repeat protein [Nonomuraea sp. NPDC000554]|uniref:tetratricopeptide repeat protein n=1 Tax=Nonomuraea sp. NPDC000554 TaxID=3154259 RepID=UPI003319F4E3